MSFLFVIARGGSRLFFKPVGGGVFVVGPESSGAHPGPVCYRKNGYLAVTDANVQLGRIQPNHFPKIKPPTKNMGEANPKSSTQTIVTKKNIITDMIILLFLISSNASLFSFISS